MKFKFLKVAIAGLIMAVGGFANAGLISDTNNDSFIDDTTGLEWMDFGINNHLTYNQVAAELEVGGLYYGWEIGESLQVETLFRNAFIGLGETLMYDSPSHIELIDGAGAFDNVWSGILKKMGIRYEEKPWFLPLQLRFASLLENDTTFGRLNLLIFTGVSYYSIRDDNFTYSDNTRHPFWRMPPPLVGYVGPRDWSSTLMSTLLVRSTVEVPEPSTLAIFALGIIGLASRRFEKSYR